jgi:hypothetical protein
MSPVRLTLVAAVLAYDRVERASDTCERKSGRSGRSELRLAMSETSDENDMAAGGLLGRCTKYRRCMKEEGAVLREPEPIGTLVLVARPRGNKESGGSYTMDRQPRDLRVHFKVGGLMSTGEGKKKENSVFGVEEKEFW